MNNWLSRLVSGKKSVTDVVTASTIASPDPIADSVAHRRRGNEFLNQGDLRNAIESYEKAVVADPNSVDALTSLGYALKETGNLEAAHSAFQNALQLQPNGFDPAYLLGQTCNELRQYEKAVAHFEKALALQPTFEPLYGELCHALFQIKALDKAHDLITSGIQRYPENASFHFFLGNLYSVAEDWQAASASYATAMKLNPNLVQAHTNLASVFRSQGDLDAATHQVEYALRIAPASPDVLACIAANQDAAGKLEEALASYEKALEGDPAHPGACRGKGNVLLKLGKPDAAIASFNMALTIEPDSAETYRDLGLVFIELGKYLEAEKSGRKALTLRPRYASAQGNLGIALMAQGKLLEAEQCYLAALAIVPDSGVYLSNLGGTQLAQGRLSEAVASFRRAAEINPWLTTAHSNLLYALSIDPAVPNVQYLGEARRFGERLTTFVGAPFTDWLVRLDDPVVRPLRIGLVSGRFCNNPVGYFLESVLAEIDPTSVEFVAYATSAREDELTLRIRRHFVEWENILGMDRTSVAEKIRADRIHILVDLNGHTEGNLLPVFALKPAPVQVSWLGYWASAGVPQIDYILAEETSLPVSEQVYFTETIHYLPETRFCFTAPTPDVPVGPLPALRQGFVTFGCFQTLTKINDRTLKLWGQVLQAVPNSRLRLAVNQRKDDAFQQQFSQRLAGAGIDPARVTLVGPVPRGQYLASYSEVDLILDTFPYAGGTTTCEALWMGVPTLTLNGSSMIARQGAAMLTCVGLDAWIAVDEADYVVKAVAHAADTRGLSNLRTTLRERSLASALFDAPRFARNLEQAFSEMWRQKMELARELPRVPSASSIEQPRPS